MLTRHQVSRPRPRH